MRKYGIYLGVLIAVCFFYEAISYAKYDGKLASIVQKKTECALCGDGEDSLKSIYKTSKGVGMICLNDWRVVRILMSPDEQAAGRGISYLQGEEGDYSIRIEHVVERRVSLVKYTSRKSNTPDIERLSKILCEECLEKVEEAVCIYGDHKGRKARAVCLVEFPGAELYPIQQSFQYYILGDYYVQSACKKNEISLTVFQVSLP